MIECFVDKSKHEHQQVEDVGNGALPQWGSSPQSKSSRHVLHAVTSKCNRFESMHIVSWNIL